MKRNTSENNMSDDLRLSESKKPSSESAQKLDGFKLLLKKHLDAGLRTLVDSLFNTPHALHVEYGYSRYLYFPRFSHIDPSHSTDYSRSPEPLPDNPTLGYIIGAFEEVGLEEADFLEEVKTISCNMFFLAVLAHVSDRRTCDGV